MNVRDLPNEIQFIILRYSHPHLPAELKENLNNRTQVTACNQFMKDLEYKWAYHGWGWSTNEEDVDYYTFLDRILTNEQLESKIEILAKCDCCKTHNLRHKILTINPRSRGPCNCPCKLNYQRLCCIFDYRISTT